MIAPMPSLNKARRRGGENRSRRNSEEVVRPRLPRLPDECSPDLSGWAGVGYGRWYPTGLDTPVIGGTCDKCGRMVAAVNLKPLIPPFKEYEDEEWWCEECRVRGGAK